MRHYYYTKVLKSVKTEQLSFNLQESGILNYF